MKTLYKPTAIPIKRLRSQKSGLVDDLPSGHVPVLENIGVNEA
jgi:hypothetical protein